MTDMKNYYQFAAMVRRICERTTKMRMERGFKIAASVGIGRDMCCIHNAAMDDSMSGWCHKNPARLKAAKQADFMVNEFAWQPSRLAEKILKNAWNDFAANS